MPQGVSPSQAMPQTVRIAFWITVAVAAWGIGDLVWNLFFPAPELTASMAKVPPELRGFARGAGIVLGLILGGGITALDVWLAWKAAWRRRNWARWGFVLLFAIGLGGIIVTLTRANGAAIEMEKYSHPVTVVEVALHIITIALLFSPSARGWFAKKAGE
jgi:hypothetical protein